MAGFDKPGTKYTPPPHRAIPVKVHENTIAAHKPMISISSKEESGISNIAPNYVLHNASSINDHTHIRMTTDEHTSSGSNTPSTRGALVISTLVRRCCPKGKR